MVKSVKEQIDSIYALMDEGEIGAAEQKLSELEQFLGREHTEMNKIRTALDFERAILEDDK